jgi:hypothetical protein
MSNSFLKPVAIALMLAVAPLSISSAQAAAVKVGSYVGIWSAKTSLSISVEKYPPNSVE